MFDIVEIEFQRFLDMVEIDGFEDAKANNFLDEDDFESYLSKDDIYKQQSIFVKKAKKVLIEKYQDKYIVYSDFCVHVLDREWFESVIKRKERVRN